MNNKELQSLKDMLLDHEGIRLKPYKDTVGKITIGIGRNLDDVGITPNEAMHLLDNDIKNVIEDLDRKLPWWRNLNNVRQRVLADMCFNLGISRLLAFKNTLASIQNGQYEKAAKEMMQSKWAQQVGRRAKRLSNMMRDGL